MNRTSLRPVQLGQEILEDRALPSCWMSGVCDPPPYSAQAGHIDVGPSGQCGEIHQENCGKIIKPCADAMQNCGKLIQENGCGEAGHENPGKHKLFDGGDTMQNCGKIIEPGPAHDQVMASYGQCGSF